MPSFSFQFELIMIYLIGKIKARGTYEKIIAGLLICLLFSGCGSSKKVMSCTLEAEQMMGLVNDSFNFEYTDEGVSKIVHSQNTFFKEANDAEESMANIKEMKKVYDSILGAKVSYKLSGKKLTSKISLDLGKLPFEIKSELIFGLPSEEWTDINVVRSSMVRSNFECTIHK